MPHNDYAAAAYPEPWQILGVQLKPFSLGHFMKLRRLDCAFVADETRNATMADLVYGVIVCSMESDPNPDRDPFWNWLSRPIPRWQRLFSWLLGKLTPAEREVYRWGRKCRGIDFTQRAEQFSAYLKQHTEFPLYWNERPETSGKSGAHWSHAVLSTLVSECGYTQKEAYNVSVAKALQDFFKWAESQGHITLMTQEEAMACGA